MSQIIFRVLLAYIISVSQSSSVILTFFNAKHWSHFINIIVLARRIGSGSIHALFPIFRNIGLNNALSRNIGNIQVIVDKPVILPIAFICRFSDTDCLAFVMLHTVSRQYKVVEFCLQNNYSFHRYYVCNRKLTSKWGAHVMGVMEIFATPEMFGDTQGESSTVWWRCVI